MHEAALHNLATDKAFHHLQCQPVWHFEQTIQQTVSWYRSVTTDPTKAAALTRGQIDSYTTGARERGLTWALN